MVLVFAVALTFCHQYTLPSRVPSHILFSLVLFIKIQICFHFLIFICTIYQYSQNYSIAISNSIRFVIPQSDIIYRSTHNTYIYSVLQYLMLPPFTSNTAWISRGMLITGISHLSIWKFQQKCITLPSSFCRLAHLSQKLSPLPM